MNTKMIPTNTVAAARSLEKQIQIFVKNWNISLYFDDMFSCQICISFPKYLLTFSVLKSLLLVVEFVHELPNIFLYSKLSGQLVESHLQQSAS